MTRAEIAALHSRMASTPRQANHVLSVLSKMFSLAEVWGFRPDGSNPCQKIERFKEEARDRFLSDEEITRLGTVLAELEVTRAEHDSVVAGIRLLLLTGLRLSELLALRWQDVDAAGVLAIRDAKAGGRLQPIGSLALEIIAALPRLSPFLLPGRHPSEPLSASTLQHAWLRIRGKADLEDVRLHDLRHTVGTLASQAGANAFMVRDTLGHKTLAMTGRYVSADAHPLRLLSDAIVGRVTAALDAGKAKVEKA